MSPLSTATLCFLFADQIEGFTPPDHTSLATETDAPAAFDRGPWARASIEMTIVRLARRPALLPLDELLSRLGDLEKRLASGTPPPPRGGGGGGPGGSGRATREPAHAAGPSSGAGALFVAPPPPSPRPVAIASSAPREPAGTAMQTSGSLAIAMVEPEPEPFVVEEPQMVEPTPLPAVRLRQEQSVIGAGDHFAVCQGYAQHFAPLEPHAESRPRALGPRRDQHAAVMAVSHDPGHHAARCGVEQQPRDELLGEALVRGREAAAAVVGAEHPRGVAPQQEGVARLHHAVHNELLRGREPPGRRVVLGDPEALGRSGVERLVTPRVLGERAGPAAARRDAPQLGPARGAVLRSDPVSSV